MSREFDVLDSLSIQGRKIYFYNITRLQPRRDVDRLPFVLKVMLENLLRKQDGVNVTAEDVTALCQWQPRAAASYQVNFTPARVVLQDFTGVPAVVDLAAMRDAMGSLGGDPALINPLCPVDLVIDHSVMVDDYGNTDSLRRNTDKEFERNRERYQFLRWGQQAFRNFHVVPPGTGIVHQVNLEYLADVVTTVQQDDKTLAFPDTLVGTDSHTTMINGLGVLGWGVGGIEAEAVMLGQPITMLIPEVIGFRLSGKLPELTTATDLVLTVTEMLRKKGVVGKFVEFFGDGLDYLPLADRATIGNMAPEYGATCGIFPIDRETLRYLELSGRDQPTVDLVEAYARAQGMWRESGAAEADYSDILELDLGQVEPCLAGPKRPQDRVPLGRAKTSFADALQVELQQRQAKQAQNQQQAEPKQSQQQSQPQFRKQRGEKLASDRQEEDLERFADEGGQTAVSCIYAAEHGGVDIELNGERHKLGHGAVVIAAITSCTNTSNPAVLMAAGLLAKKAVERGLKVKPWVKTSLAPGSQVVPVYLRNAGLMEPLQQLGFYLVGFGCTTCIGNSGPLAEPVHNAIQEGNLVVASVLSGNRNFEGRIHPEVRANYLASPPLVVAYALAGTLQRDLTAEPLGEDSDGKPVYLRDLWPSQAEIAECIAAAVSSRLFRDSYADVFAGTDAWRALPDPEGDLYTWPPSTYVHKPPFFEGMSLELDPLQPVSGARCLVKLGDSITTDHISPAGTIKPDSPAGRYLQEQGVAPVDFNSYGSRRGNHQVMWRGTFANTRLRNQLAPGTEGGWTAHFPSGDVVTIFDASMRYRQEGVPLIILAGREYGTGSSRDWAAKGTNLLGVKAVIAESFERIHRSNLVGFGVLPLQFMASENAEQLGLRGDELFHIEPLEGRPETLTVSAEKADGDRVEFKVAVRIETAVEWDYYRHGGILHYVLRTLASRSA